MGLTLYYGSGSPYAWRAQFALEQKALSYERRVLSFSAREQLKPEFIALNPRHKVPVLVDGDFVLYESNAIVEYLDEAYPGQGAPLFPGDARQRALVRRLVLEVDNYFDKAVDIVSTQAFGKKPDEREAGKLAEGRAAVAAEAGLFTRAMRGDFLAGPLSAADFALYPLVAYLDRAQQVRLPDLDVAAMLTPELRAWQARVEALPFFAKTIPPHWQQPAA
jgi:glutathione S-transferase